LGSFLDSRPQHGVKRMFKYVLIYLKEVVYPHAQCAGVPRKLGVQKRVGCVPFYERSDRMVCRASECLSPHSQARYAIAVYFKGWEWLPTPLRDSTEQAPPSRLIYDGYVIQSIVDIPRMHSIGAEGSNIRFIR
jgi:hypothetical protein